MKRLKVGRIIWEWIPILLLLLQLISMLLSQSEAASTRKLHRYSNYNVMDYPPVQLLQLGDHVVLDNGIIRVTFSNPGGMISGIKYNGIGNLLENSNEEDNRGYWDMNWSKKDHPQDTIDKLDGTSMTVVKQDDNQVEISFARTWGNTSTRRLPLNIDKRFIMLRGCSGLYSYAILERLEGWPAVILSQGRIVFKLENNLFKYMAVSDDRQRIMPTNEDRVKGQVLDYPEAVLLTNPSNPYLKGEVDDKYQYSSDNKDSRVHGWISQDPPTGFWVITPSNEFKTGGPFKQDLTSHTGPTSLAMFFSTHYAGPPSMLDFVEGEAWEKVLGPVFIYVNSVSSGEDPLKLWADAKEQMLVETESWPYNFPASEDYLYSEQRGVVSGRFLVQDSYIGENPMPAKSGHIGLAPVGRVGWWQRESKGYQFWTQTDDLGYFIISSIRPGKYCLNGWVTGFIGDYMLDYVITVQAGGQIKLGNMIYVPPRMGPTLWEIGIPDRSAAEFFVPDPYPELMNKLYQTDSDKYRQYGLWDRYPDSYPNQDLVYTVETSNYQSDWFFAQVNRKVDDKYVPTTWTIVFNLTNIVNGSGDYTLRLALASATDAELQVRVNDGAKERAPLFSTGLIGRDNAIARHGIHGQYLLYSVNIPGSLLVANSTNIITLTQSRGAIKWRGILYDYLRLEGPNRTQT